MGCSALKGVVGVQCPQRSDWDAVPQNGILEEKGAFYNGNFGGKRRFKMVILRVKERSVCGDEDEGGGEGEGKETATLKRNKACPIPLLAILCGKMTKPKRLQEGSSLCARPLLHSTLWC